MRILRVEMDGMTTSFRHPHFLTGRQPSYPLPPPATILGHIASALGEYPRHELIRFAYSFTCTGHGDDMENIYMARLGESVPQEIRRNWPYPVNLVAEMNPILREVLVHPHLTLYLDAPSMLDDLYHAFRSPRYMVLLGRSQDLGGYRRVDLIETEESEAGYLEGTLLPRSERERFRNVVMMMMPRYIDPNERRRVQFSPYLLLEQRAFVVPADQVEEGSLWAITQPDEKFTLDPDSMPTAKGFRRILYWHSFTGNEDLTVEME